MTKLSVIIVSFNTISLLKDCLVSVFKDLPSKSEVIVIDNASTDGSPQLVKKHFPKAKLIINQENLGFARANNQGIGQSRGEFILLLNSDTIVKPGSLPTLIDFIDSHPKVGIASPKLLNKDGSTQQNGGSLPRLSNIFAWMLFLDDIPLLNLLLPSYQQARSSFYNQTRSVGWAAGTAMLLRRKMLDQIGLLDENIFMYSEDTDLCYRARQHGWQIYLISSAQILHLGQASSTSQNAVLGEFKGLKYYFKKHKPAWEMPVLTLILKLGIHLRVLLFGTIIGNDQKAQIYRQAAKLV